MTVYIQLRRKSAGFSREHRVTEYYTVKQFIDNMTDYLNGEDPVLTEGLFYAFFLHRQRLEHHKDTVICKVFDADGQEYENDGFSGPMRSGEWLPKPTRRRRQ